MNAQQMWDLFTSKENITAKYDAWAFGVEADELAKMVLDGVKTATSSAFPLYELDGDALPVAGQYNVILNANDEAVCIVRTERVYTVPFHRVDKNQAWKEGEGERTLTYWRKVHSHVFGEWMADAGLEFTETMPVVCEEFVRVFP